MNKAPSYAPYVSRCMRLIRSAIEEANWSRNELRQRLGWTADLKTLYRYLDFPEQGSSMPQADLIFGCADILGINLHEAASLPIRPVARVEHDPRYIMAQLKGRRCKSPCYSWARCIQEHFISKSLPIRVRIAPTHDYSDDPAEKLSLLGSFGALEVERALFKNGPISKPHTILAGLGKHMNALVTSLLVRHKAQGRFVWLPAMGDDNHWDYFSANCFCEALSAHLGGMRPITLNTPSFIEIDDDDYLRHAHSDKSYQALFERHRSSAVNNHYSAWSATTALLGCGVAAPGNPLYESPKRQRDPRRLRKGDYPAVGDLNGFYQCVARDGTPAWLDPVQKSGNLEAWDANRRAIGAPPELLKSIADGHRDNPRGHGGGVIVLANSAARAPLVYTALHLGLINSIVMDYECAAALVFMLTDSRQVLPGVPDRVAY